MVFGCKKTGRRKGGRTVRLWKGGCMKKVYYAIYNEKEEIYRWDGTERFLITISSSAKTLEEAMETVTGETGGTCFGPEDAEDWVEEFISENWDSFAEMEKEDEDERISHLADEWGITVEDLGYLR